MAERKFKVGDEVLIKGVISKIDDRDFTHCPYCLQTTNHTVWVEEDMLSMDNSTKTYEQGLEEGWELAGKIVDMKYDLRDKILGTNIDNHTLDAITDNFTAAQVKEKIEQYERLNSIKVGDKVLSSHFIGGGIITHIRGDDTADVIFSNGKVGSSIPIKSFTKAGSNVDISAFLKKLWS